MNIMAKNSVNKSALVRDYLSKYPDKGPAAIAKQIGDELRGKNHRQTCHLRQDQTQADPWFRCPCRDTDASHFDSSKKESGTSQSEIHPGQARTGECRGPVTAHCQLEGSSAKTGQGRSQAHHRLVLKTCHGQGSARRRSSCRSENNRQEAEASPALARAMLV
jgi:hypothetical protein